MVKQLSFMFLIFMFLIVILSSYSLSVGSSSIIDGENNFSDNSTHTINNTINNTNYSNGELLTEVDIIMNHSNITVTPNPQLMGHEINFSVHSNNNNIKDMKLLICKTNHLKFENNSNCKDGQWCSNNNDNYEITNDTWCTYNLTYNNSNENNYFLFLCNKSDVCSSSISGIFNMSNIYSLSILDPNISTPKDIKESESLDINYIFYKNGKNITSNLEPLNVYIGGESSIINNNFWVPNVGWKLNVTVPSNLIGLQSLNLTIDYLTDKIQKTINLSDSINYLDISDNDSDFEINMLDIMSTKSLPSEEIFNLYSSGVGSYDDCIHYYKFDNSLIDSAGSSDAVNSGATYTASGKINGAYDYYHVDDNKMTISNLSMAQGDPFSINVWFARDRTGTNDGLFDDTSTPDNTKSIYGKINTANKFEVYLNFYYTWNSVGTITDSNWHMFTLTWDGTDTCKMYIDGSYDSTHTYAYTLRETNEMTIGIDKYGSGFNGKIDEFGIWNVELTSTIVTDIYNSGTGSQYPDASPADPALKIHTVNTMSPITLSSGTSTNVYTSFNSSGIGIKANEVNINFTNIGESTIQSTSCLSISNESTWNYINCTTSMQYYTSSGLWNLTIHLNNGSESILNSTTNVTINTLDSISLNATNLDFGSSAPYTNDVPATTINVSNQGNTDYTSVTIKAYHLNNSKGNNILPSSICSNDVNAANTGCNTLSNNTAVEITGITIDKGPNEGKNIYTFMDIPIALLPTKYSSYQSWVVEAS